MRACLLLLIFACSIPVSAEAQSFRRPFKHCCETCRKSHNDCECGQTHTPAIPSNCVVEPLVVPKPTVQLQSITQTRPVIKTEMRPQQVTTYRNVVETHVRNEQVVQSVPKTTYRNVTVDEGNYQMVWVPKPVTKQVAETVLQQQVTTRSVPYQITRRVPQVSTQLVPVQTIQHVTEAVPVSASLATTHMPMRSASCNVCEHDQQAIAFPFLQPQMGYIPAPQAYAPMSASIETLPPITVPTPQTAFAPSAGSPTALDKWESIPARGAADSRNRAYESPATKDVPNPSDEYVPPRRTTSRFVPVPSAATVWNSKQTSMK